MTSETNLCVIYRDQDIQSICPNVQESQKVQELGREQNDTNEIPASEIIPVSRFSLRIY